MNNPRRLVGAAIILFATICTVDAGTWQTIRNHNENRPNVSQQLKPTHEHYVYSKLDYGTNHPFDRSLQQESDTENLNYSSNSESSDYDILRLRFLTEPLNSLRGQSSAIDAKIDAILHEVLPSVQQTWMSHLSVIPVQGAIPIRSSDCFGIYKELIPTSILINGVKDADLVIFVSAADELTTSSFQQIEVCGPGILAVATSCVMDQFDRPVVGFINFCLSEIHRRLRGIDEGNLQFPQVELSNILVPAKSAKDQGIVEAGVVADSQLVAAHEVGHVLGIDSELFLFFRDQETGKPLTPRPFQERVVECVGGTRQLRVFPSEATLRGEITSRGRLYYDLVTPRAQTVVRNHFNCQSLVGARLENQPTGESCTGAHFDERLFYSELMSSIFSGTSAMLSPLTLALLEDSGWYKVFYEGSQASPFGHAAGCSFVNDDCIINEEVPEYATGSFCTSPTQVELLSGRISADDNDLLCDPVHHAIAVCDLFNLTELILTPGFNFDQNGTRYFSDSSLQALASQTDWCPVPSIPTGVDCTDSNGPQFLPTYVGEEYGSSSRCVNFEADDFPRRVAGCFDIQCNATSRKVVVNGETCDFDGQRLQIQRLSGLTSKMVCPQLAVVCPQLYCPRGCSGRGICNYDTNVCECFDPHDDTGTCNLLIGTRAPSMLSLPTTAPAPCGSSCSSVSSKAVSVTVLTLVLFYTANMF